MAEAILSSSSSSRSETPPPGENNIAQNKMSVLQETADNSSSLERKLSEIETHGDQSTSTDGCSASGGTELEGTLDKLLQKQRNELMFELRRIQHGDRPVTGQGHKEAVENFFTGVRSEPVEQNRPDNVVVEVNALVERRPVSSVLQGSGFRRSLENALRGAIGGARSRFAPARRQRRADSPVVSVASSVSTTENVNEALRSSDMTTVPEQHRDVQEQRRIRENVRIPQPRRVQNVQVSTSVDDAELPNQRQSSVTAAQAWLQNSQHQQTHAGQDNVLSQIEEAQREELIMEISELVQRQLVTETLHGNFRNVLERRMHERLENSDTDGRRVQQFVQSLPQSTVHVRNDFSSLGINVADTGESQSDHLDEMSVVSATATVAVPYAQSNLALTKELHSLKSQIKEMMNMMKLNFDLTMDVQRSVRQEVAAAMNDRNGTGTASGLTSRPTNEDQCLICLEKDVDTVLYQCGHMCVCYTCGLNLRQRGNTCPVCRAPIRDIIRAYRCNPREGQ